MHLFLCKAPVHGISCQGRVTHDLLVLLPATGIHWDELQFLFIGIKIRVSLIVFKRRSGVSQELFFSNDAPSCPMPAWEPIKGESRFFQYVSGKNDAGAGYELDNTENKGPE